MKHDWIGCSNKAVAILRVSSHRQRDNTSHEVQEHRAKDYAHERGLGIVTVEAIVESAKDADDRTKFRAAINNALKKRIRHVLFYMTDREARNFTDIETNHKLVKQGRLVIHYVNDGRILHLGSPASDFLMRQFQAFQDKQVSAVISEKVNDAQRRKAEDGWYPGNHPPLGYVHIHLKDSYGRERKRGTTIGPDPDERKVRQVVREFELRAQGCSYHEIRRRIIAEGFIDATRTGNYHISVIEKRLKNPFYRGWFKWQGVEYQGKHSLFVPHHILDAVDASFGKVRPVRKTSDTHGVLAGGWLRCADSRCGCYIVHEMKQKPIKQTGDLRTYHYYHCTNGKRVHDTMKGMTVVEDAVWSAFGAAIDDVAITEDFARQIADALNTTRKKMQAATLREIEGFKAALIGLEAKENRAFDLYDAGHIDHDTYQRQMGRIRQNRSEFADLMAQAQLKITDAGMETAQTILELATTAKEQWKSRAPNERRDLLDLILSNPVLDGTTVRYKLRKPFRIISQMAQTALTDTSVTLYSGHIGNTLWLPQGDLGHALEGDLCAE
jgi:site-specific DNA recombinase